jgi:hypothetical protein
MTESNIITALAQVLPTIEAAKKNKANPAFKGTKYADLGSVLDAIAPIAAKGLWFRQVSHDCERGVSVETLYVHADSGTELSAGRVFVPANKNDAQGYGSAQTYARRYGLQLAFGLATEDNDGNAAVKSPNANDAHTHDAQTIEAAPRNTHGMSKAAVGVAMKDLYAQMDTVATWDEWYVLKNAKADLFATIERDFPKWWNGSDTQPAEFVPLRRKIELLHIALGEDIPYEGPPQ